MNLNLFLIKKIRQQIAPLCFLLILTISVSCNKSNKDDIYLGLPLPVMTMKKDSAVTSFQYLGAIEGITNVEIRPQVEGILDDIYVDEGEYIQANKPLFKINELPYKELLKNAKANVELEYARLKNAQTEIDKLAPLVENEVIADVQLKTAKANYEIAKAALSKAKAQEATAEINLGFTIIKAPVSGYIGRIPKRIGNLVSKSDSQPMTVLSDIHQVYVYFSMSESDYLFYEKMKKDSTARKLNPNVKLVLADGTTYNHTGMINANAGQIDRTTGSITLRAKFDNPDNLLRTGNTGKIILEQIHPDVILLPQVATTVIQDKKFVFVLRKDNTVERREIKIMGKSGTNYIINDPYLKPSERVVIAGLDKLTEGTKVNPMKPGQRLNNN